jgi:outer membrane protein assembly factor BamB
LILTVFLSAAAVAAEPASWDGLTFHKAAGPLAAGARAGDWPRFLGLEDRPVSAETKLNHALPAGGPPLVWECEKGESYASPAIVGERLLLFHNTGGKETLDCLDAATGKRWWRESYEVDYRDDFGYGSGPRAAPVVSGGKVVTFGVASRLQCRELETGKLVWEHDCENEYELDGSTDDYGIVAYAECPKCKTVLELEVPSKEEVRADYWADYDPNN